MGVTIVTILVIITIAPGVPAKVKRIGKSIGVSTDRDLVYPGHPPNPFINGLKGSNPQFPRACV